MYILCIIKSDNNDYYTENTSTILEAYISYLFSIIFCRR